ncbi:MAG: hypothetical protein ACFFCJ_09195, partial [Promethearchaeota archaeon]
MKKALPFKKRNLASLALLSILVFSMFIGISALPFRAMATSLSEPTIAREDYDTLFPEIGSQSSSSEEPVMNIASNLDEYLATGTIPDALRSVDGALEVYATANRQTDLVGLSAHMKIVNVITQEVGLIIQGFVSDPKAIYAISDYPGVGFVWGNEYANRVLNERPIEGPYTDNFFARAIMGIDQVEADFPAYDGTGTVIGIVDTGVDFGVTDLVDAIALDAS